MSGLSETGDPYVPDDYDGPVQRCRKCGNDAPMRQADGEVVAECTPCFIGGVVIATVTPTERDLLSHVLQEENGA